MDRKLKNIIKIYSLIAFLPVFVFLTACNDKDNNLKFNSSDELYFIGYYTDNSATDTRADKEIHAVTSSLMKGYPFYISLSKVGNENESKGPYPYDVPAGRQGELAAKDSEKKLNWFDETTDHNFWSWTLPWEEPEYVPSQIENTTIYFPNPQESTEAVDYIIQSKYTQNILFENFFGAFSGPYNYRRHGQYVDLEFYHLVSKIIVDEVYLNFTGLNTRPISSYDFTLYDVPTEGTLFTNPLGEDEYAKLPYVKANEGKNGNIRYSLSNSGNVMYIAPEVDLSNISFSIRITDSSQDLTEYTDNVEFFGTFANIKFDRGGISNTYGGPYDQGDEDITKLHAGEELHLTMVVTVGQTPGMGASVPRWWLKGEQPATSHTRPGAYTQGEMYDIINGGRSDTSIHLNYYYELYGSKNPDDPNHKYFNLYENLDIAPGGSFLPCYDPYVIDGLGHLLNLTNNPSKIWIENYRNIYIKSGNYLIYIDPEGYVYRVDPDTFEYLTEKDENNKMAPLGEDQQMTIEFNPLKVTPGNRGSDAPRE